MKTWMNPRSYVIRLAGALVLMVIAPGAGTRAQDLDLGKTAPELFNLDCTACHRGPQGLAKNRSAGALADFLRQHYTTSSRTASQIAGYLLSVTGNPRAERQKNQPEERPTKKGERQRREPATAMRPAEADRDNRPSRKSRGNAARPSAPAALTRPTEPETALPPVEARMPPPVEPAEVSGLTPGTPAETPKSEAPRTQPAFTAPSP